MITKGRTRSLNIVDIRKTGGVGKGYDSKGLITATSNYTGSRSLSYKQVNNNRMKKSGKNRGNT